MTDGTVHVVRVFTDASGAHGNPLGVVLDAGHVDAGERQSVAAALAFSETVFVGELPHAALHIHTPTTELPFAGHPTVGTAWLLDHAGTPVDTLRPPAGDVVTWADGPLRWVRAHATWCPDTTLRRLTDPAEVDALVDAPDGLGSVYAWAWIDERAGHVRARMFASAHGIAEDEATGSAAVVLTAELARSLTVHQGRGSKLHTALAREGFVDLGGRVEHVGTRPTLGRSGLAFPG